MIVIDASIVLHILADTKVDASVLQKVRSSGDLVAPHLIDLEFLSAIRRQTRLKEISETRALESITDFGELKIHRKSVQHLNAAIWALRNNITPYDAAYVVLAAELGVPLLTRDKKLAQAIASHTQVVLI